MPDLKGVRIDVDRLPNGYWWGRLKVLLPDQGLPVTFENDSFHTMHEALEWARMTIEGLAPVARNPITSDA